MVRRHSVRMLVAVLVAAFVVPFASAGTAGAIGSAPSTPIGARIRWATTNGDILAITKVAGTSRNLIAFGGNFTRVITPDGVSRVANHFAVVDEMTGALVYAGNANSYVRAITSLNGTIYVGGDFTSFGGVARARAAALNASFAVTGWNPSPGSRVRALTVASGNIVYGGDSSVVRATNPTTGAAVWSQSVSGGSVRAMTVSPNGANLYVGGLFEVYGGLTRHGIIKANPANGVPDSAFNARFRVDSGVGSGGSYDGQAGNVLAFNADGSRLLVGVAGQGSDEFKTLNPSTGALAWGIVLPGDCQGIGVVGSTYVLGYHRHDNNPWPYFGAQVEAANGRLTTFDPGVTGYQGNADGGNNGVQAIYADPVNRRLFLAGAFTSPVKSLAVFTW
ncbi:hypothetical protein [Dermatobacter hominis]|uniref:hypothetical protein n=1 Tax=Dermatobacter hominis TaxID=2884263 RepID=UPI001D11196C|nr:hypothetical protein [Dermatobacter hominis]UDY34485.1 hypothetical protein LH044_14205 [Dermatobacter hominis]